LWVLRQRRLLGELRPLLVSAGLIKRRVTRQWMSRFASDVLLEAMTRPSEVDQTRYGTIRGGVRLGLIVAGAVALGCSSKDTLLHSRDAGFDTPAAGNGGSGTANGGAGANASGGLGGHLATGGTVGSGGLGGAAASGGSGGSATGGAGGMAGTIGQVSGTGGHDIAPVMCGTSTCPLGSQCCHACDGTMTCAGSCAGFVCPADAGTDASAIPCGGGSCGPLEACVHPPRGGTCNMPEAGGCPADTILQGGCCWPPDAPACVTIDRACNAPTVTCGCFSKDPCGGGCASALITGRDIACSGA